MHQNQNKNTPHVPVLLGEVIEYLDPKAGDRYLDLTAGYGGHASEVIARTNVPEAAVLVDKDENSIKHLQKLPALKKATVIHADFLEATKMLQEQGKQFELILADLGVSSPHLDIASRGFSLSQEGPLDMRMDQQQALSASEIVNTYSDDELIRILREYGEEPKARAIAKAIIAARPLTTTTELAAIVARAWRGRSKTHPATRTFQAIRIAVNSELESLNRAIPLWADMLAPNGRLVVISFHSLEDRIVKQGFAELSGDRFDAELDLLTKQPVTAGQDELVFNPRARSAKLRACMRK